jgi:hypothetical protein
MLNQKAPLRFKPRYDRALWLVFLVVLLLPLGREVSLVVLSEPLLALAMLVVTGVAALALWSVLPRAIELWPDRIRIVLGWPWGFNIPLGQVSEVLPARGWTPWFRLGVAFATSFKEPVQIRRTKGLPVLISPSDPTGFINGVNDALANARGNPDSQ